MSKLRSGNSVKVVSGKFRGTIDTIKKIDRKSEVVYLESANRVKFVKSSKTAEKKIEEKTKKILIPIHISNVTLWEEKK